MLIPGTYSQLLLHVVFSTKGRAALIKPELRDRLYGYIGGMVRAEKGTLYAIGGMPDHIHLLLRWRTDPAVADLMRTVKAGSSHWVHQTFPAFTLPFSRSPLPHTASRLVPEPGPPASVPLFSNSASPPPASPPCKPRIQAETLSRVKQGMNGPGTNKKKAPKLARHFGAFGGERSAVSKVFSSRFSSAGTPPSAADSPPG